MNNLQRAKEELETSIANAMEALKVISEAEKNGDKAAKWEPKGGEYYIDTYGDVKRAPSLIGTRLLGTERETKEEAESASVWMRKFDRLLCWFEEEAQNHHISIQFDTDSVSIRFVHFPVIIDDLRTKIRDGIVEL